MNESIVGSGRMTVRCVVSHSVERVICRHINTYIVASIYITTMYMGHLDERNHRSSK